MKQYFTREYIMRNRKQILRRAAVLIIAAAAIFVFIFRTGDKEKVTVEKSQITAEAKTETGKKSVKKIIVDVSGQVKAPQVIEIKAGSRISDAIAAAGGLTDKADISGVNRAAELSDGEKIYIPAKGEGQQNGQSGASSASQDGGTGISAGSSSGSSAGSSSASPQKISINSASNSELQELTGVGPAIAEKILLYRSKNGGFKSLEDLKNVSGIGDKTFEKLKDQITL